MDNVASVMSKEVTIESIKEDVEAVRTHSNQHIVRKLASRIDNDNIVDLYVNKSNTTLVYEVTENGVRSILTDHLTTAVDVYNNKLIVSVKPEPNVVSREISSGGLKAEDIVKDINHKVVLHFEETPFKTKSLTMVIQGTQIRYAVEEDGNEIEYTGDLNLAVEVYNKIKEDDTLVRKTLEAAILNYKVSAGVSKRSEVEARTKLFSLVENV